MVAIRIADHVAHASTYADGQVIYDLIAPRIVAGEPVEVSFSGIHAVPSAFVNAAFVRLLEVAPLEKVQSALRITDSTKFINDMIRRRFDFASHPS
jgi:STAS-like domain of unknown function (DUF4325)